MFAQILEKPLQPLVYKQVAKPQPKDNQLLIRVSACGICRTDLHILEGELPHPKLPLIPGHQIVGYVEAIGSQVRGWKVGQRVGIPWLAKTCGSCLYCQSGRENLCDRPLFTGYTLDGGFAQYCVAYADYVFPLESPLSDAHAAPLLCAGMLGYRALRLLGEAQTIGFFGFGVSAHILSQITKAQVFAFTRPGDAEAQAFAKSCGAVWTGDSTTAPPTPLDGALIFASDGSLIPLALKAVRKGGSVICAAIHMSPIPSFSYELLWQERRLQSVANLTRTDATDFLQLASHLPLQTKVTTFPLSEANTAIAAMRAKNLCGAVTLITPV